VVGEAGQTELGTTKLDTITFEGCHFEGYVFSGVLTEDSQSQFPSSEVVRMVNTLRGTVSFYEGDEPCVFDVEFVSTFAPDRPQDAERRATGTICGFPAQDVVAE
jgi:hypothetical protein